MEEIVKHINDTNASYRAINAGDAKNTDLFLDNEHYELFKDSREQITVRFNKENLQKAILFIASILPRKYDNSATHKVIRFSSAFVFDQLAFLDAFFTIDGMKVETRTQVWNARKDVLKKNGEIDNRFYFNGLLEDVPYTSFNGEEKTGKFTIRNYVAGSYSDLHIKKASDGIFDVWVTNTQNPYDDGKDKYHEITDNQSFSLQQIFYGAPGTGKSNTIKRTVDDQGKICFRTTFHPDSDYSTFVGCYKPTMKRSTITKDGVTTREEKIVYRFEPQAFTNAYVQAWKSKEDVYLVIEEINRGNCAQIFGDLFQLLDRKNGESEYPINADTALADYLQVALADSNRDDIPVEVKSGMKLKLPSNLYIWATMNTSDQSLFPIDSAFKRRWDWTYIPIKQHDEGYRIKIDTVTYDWWGFLEKINQVIGDTTSSEDKKLGYFFVKAEDKEIGADKFVSKVLFYLWNDVFKNYGFDNPIFSRGENKKFAFSDFFTKEGTPETSMVNQFLRKLDETIDKENSFEKIPDVNDAPSSLMVKYNGESIEGTSARNKYVELVKLVVAEKGGEQVANCIGAELTRTPAEGSTRMYKPIGDTGWYLATNNGIDAIKKNINKIKEALGVDIEIE
jgi:GTPase subunit of restriction endonuclease